MSHIEKGQMEYDFLKLKFKERIWNDFSKCQNVEKKVGIKKKN